VQGAYLIEAPPGSTPLQAVSSLGVTFKNLIRPLGLSRVGAPSPLFGSGMAVPWELLRAAPVARESLVEDAELGIELALAGHPAVFCPESRVTSPLPRRDRDGIVQRKRWEHGSLGIIVSQVPRLLRGALRQRRVDLLWMALDACVPPLSLLVLCWLGVTAVAVASGWRSGAWLPLGILLASATVLAAGFFLGWLVFCRSTVSVSTLARIPAYILKKLPIYGTWLLGRRSRWARTKRDEDG
jgi:cellulose synthase/poly-beta-1,6-N-acetylglucosamine synthase-like glycosyltransferase